MIQDAITLARTSTDTRTDVVGEHVALVGTTSRGCLDTIEVEVSSHFGHK